jgi:hypothetical protein
MKSKDQQLLEEAYQSIYENTHGDNWAETAWQDITEDGKTVKVTFKDLLEFSKDIPVEELSVEDLKHLALHKTKTDPETLANIQKANLDYPILVLHKTKDKQRQYSSSSALIQHKGLVSILDGHHRLQKAIVNEIPKIKAKMLRLSEMPEDWQGLFA